MRMRMRHRQRLYVKGTVIAAHAVLHHLFDADGDAGRLGGPLLHLDRHLDALPLLLQHLQLELGLVAPPLVVDQQGRRRPPVVAVRAPRKKERGGVDRDRPRLEE